MGSRITTGREDRHSMLRLAALVLGLLAVSRAQAEGPTTSIPAREPAIPLIAHDPYFSIWSMADRLTDEPTRHWTRAPHPLNCLLRIDGRLWRLIGNDPVGAEPFPQTDVQVRPTTTLYRFTDGAVRIELQFLTPAIPSDLDLMSRPVSYLTWHVSSEDGAAHQVSIVFAASGLLSVNDPGQVVRLTSGAADQLVRSVRVGTVDQPILGRSGDSTRIDWGQLILGTGDPKTPLTAAPWKSIRDQFAKDGGLADSTLNDPQPATEDGPALAALLNFGTVSDTVLEKVLILAYDDNYSIDYMGQWLKPYWARAGARIDAVLNDSWQRAEEALVRCRQFDEALGADLLAMGGPLYARIGALAHRQSLAGGKLVADASGMPLYFSKENTSNGCIGTVDVIYPQFPHLVLMNPGLARAAIVPVLAYSNSSRWKFPFAPHDLGTYPTATGQVYGGGERTEENQMPVEESGNMLLMAAAIAVQENSADFVAPYWPLLGQWARYCAEEGFDPANQLCTDDFAGHLARNTNLSIKAILGLASYGKLAELRGEPEIAEGAYQTARALARRWMKMADAGDHYRLTFDPGDTWSQKYNLVWDRILKLNIFPPEVVEKELAFYAGKLEPCGLPLDSRKKFTKADWEVWTASMAPDRAGFERLIAPLGRYLDETPDRLPFSDFYWADSGKTSGMHARPVIGGVFIRLLTDREIWTKWASRAPALTGAWAPIPPVQTFQVLVPTAREEKTTWSFTLKDPGPNWMSPAGSTEGWEQAPGGFGTRGTPGSEVQTTWDTPDIWIRRTFQLPANPTGDLRLRIHHDEDAEVYLNGQLLVRLGGFTGDYKNIRLSREAQALFHKTGPNVLAIHCHQTSGGQYIDAGFVAVEESTASSPSR